MLLVTAQCQQWLHPPNNNAADSVSSWSECPGWPRTYPTPHICLECACEKLFRCARRSSRPMPIVGRDGAKKFATTARWVAQAAVRLVGPTTANGARGLVGRRHDGTKGEDIAVVSRTWVRLVEALLLFIRKTSRLQEDAVSEGHKSARGPTTFDISLRFEQLTSASIGGGLNRVHSINNCS